MLRQIGLCPRPQAWKAALSILLSPCRALKPPSCPWLIWGSLLPCRLREVPFSPVALPIPHFREFLQPNLLLHHLSLQEEQPHSF